MIRFSSPKTRYGLLFGIAVSLFFCGTNASAQDYVGGSFSISNTANQISTASDHTNSFSFNVAPDFGWEFGEQWAVGVRPTLGFSQASSGNHKDQVFSLGVNPYARYKFLTANRFGLWAEAGSNLSYNFTQIKSDGYARKNHILNYGVQLLPVVTYQLGNHVSLETRLNIFSVVMNGSHASSDEQTLDTFTCGLSATSKNIIGSLGDITVGFLYHF